MSVDAELQLFRDRVVVANGPEALFGTLTGAKRDKIRVAKGMYHRFALVAHEDRYTAADDKAVAHEAFARLSALWVEAQRRIEDGSYGKPAKPTARFKGRHAVYDIFDGFAEGDVATLYRATWRLPTKHVGTALVKVARHASLNDLIANEAAALRKLMAGKAGKYYPNLMEALRLSVGVEPPRAANVLAQAVGYVPLPAIVAAYPEGVHPRHFVWIFKRLLFAVGYAHSQGLVHGAVLPPHILVHPKTHGVMLVDWCYSAPLDGRIGAISGGYRSWYAPEVLAKHAATPATDIYMAARCMLYALGHDGDDVDALPTTPVALRASLRACLLKAPSRRPDDAWALQDELTETAKMVYGAPRYAPLTVD